MPFVVDGSNVGGFLAGERGSRDAPTVLRRIMPWARGRRRVIVVFDGLSDRLLATDYGGLTIRFSGSQSADSVIRRQVSQKGSNWIVVTDDRELQRSCRRLGAQLLSVADLMAQIPEEPSASSGGEEDPVVDVDDWEQFFRDSST